MPLALDTISGRVTNPGGTLTAWTLNTGDSATVRNFPDGSRAFILDANALGATAPTLQVRSPRMHDNLQDLRFAQIAANSADLWPTGAVQRLYAQDLLSISEAGGGAETDIGSLLVFYEDLPGVSAQLVTWEQIRSRVVNLVTVETSNVSGATLGDYSGAVALNAGATDILKANVSYALLGYGVNTMIGRVCLRGPDTGNLRVSGPGTTDKAITPTWFKDLAIWTGLPCIPIINAANKASTFVDITHHTNAITVLVDTIWAELSAA